MNDEFVTQNWYHTRRHPDAIGGLKRLYYFANGDSFGIKHDDGKIYYRLSCSYWFGDWIEEQDKTLWRSYGSPHRAIYIVREELMTLIALTWL